MAQLTWRDISAPQANMQGIATAGNLFNTAMGNFQSILDRKVENDTSMALRQLQEAQTPEQAKQIGSNIQGAFVDPTKVNTQVDTLTKALQDKQFKEQDFKLREDTFLSNELNNIAAQDLATLQANNTREYQNRVANVQEGNLAIKQKEWTAQQAEQARILEYLASKSGTTETPSQAPTPEAPVTAETLLSPTVDNTATNLANDINNSNSDVPFALTDEDEAKYNNHYARLSERHPSADPEWLHTTALQASQEGNLVERTGSAIGNAWSSMVDGSLELAAKARGGYSNMWHGYSGSPEATTTPTNPVDAALTNATNNTPVPASDTTSNVEVNPNNRAASTLLNSLNTRVINAENTQQNILNEYTQAYLPTAMEEAKEKYSIKGYGNMSLGEIQLKVAAEASELAKKRAEAAVKNLPEYRNIQLSIDADASTIKNIQTTANNNPLATQKSITRAVDKNRGYFTDMLGSSASERRVDTTVLPLFKGLADINLLLDKDVKDIFHKDNGNSKAVMRELSNILEPTVDSTYGNALPKEVTSSVRNIIAYLTQNNYDIGKSSNEFDALVENFNIQVMSYITPAM